jgi:hypothetical protein
MIVTVLKYGGLIVASLIFLLAIATAIGAMQPVSHVATRSELFAVPQRTLWDMSIAAFGRMNDGSYAIVDERAPVHLTTSIVNKQLPYGGSWSYDFAPANGGTMLTVVEHGEVYNPFFRFVSRYVIGHNRTIETYFSDLRKSVADHSATVTPSLPAF